MQWKTRIRAVAGHSISISRVPNSFQHRALEPQTNAHNTVVFFRSTKLSKSRTSTNHGAWSFSESGTIGSSPFWIKLRTARVETDK
jgi:RNA:NAD 2'-phosphotransferase (TPT1/KptA family)